MRKTEKKFHCQETTGNKHGAVRAESHKIKFDSKKEAKRYEELMIMLKAGEIENLKLQRQFTLQEGFKTIDGITIRPIRYIADFTYTDSNGNMVIEDVKSEHTRKLPEYRIKYRMMAQLGYMIKEIL